MAASQDERNPVDCLAEEFAERLRHGERPSLSEYVEKYPEHAEEIRDIFPALAMMEQLKPGTADLTGAFGNDATEVTGTRLERLGDYRILREVGRGGMGVVYEAEQVSLGRHVALKVLPEQALLNPTHLERFRREAKAAAKLHHTNIVPVYGVGEADGVHFYAMQFIRGEGLDLVLNDLRHMRNQPSALSQGSMAASLVCGQFRLGQAFHTDTECPAEKPDLSAPSSSSLSGGPVNSDYCRSVARIALQVAEALAYAHRQGVLHRDIKPSNLLLDAQGIVWVTDFGLAKAEGADELTHTGDIVGTMRFMAPERFDGTSLPQSDIYALGLTLYELLTLRHAFDDSNKAKMIERIAHQPPVPPRKIDRLIPRDLETVVLKCLAKDPADRYSSAESLAEDLRRFLADRPVRARRAGPGERLWRWARRNPAIAMLLGCVAALLVAVAAVSTYAAVKTNRALTKVQRAEREGRLREAEALISQAHATRYSRQVGQRFETLAALEKAATIGRELDQPPEWFDRLRNEAIGALALPDWRVVHECQALPPGPQEWDYDANQLIYARKDSLGRISVRRVADDEENTALQGIPGETWIALSPNGRYLICFGYGRNLTWDLASSPPIQLIKWESGGCGEVFHPDGRHLLLSHDDGSLFMYDLMLPGAPRRLLAKLSSGPVRQPVFNSGGDKLAVVTDDYSVVRFLDVKSGKEIAAPWRPKAHVVSLTWHPAGKFLAAACDDHRIRIWDTTIGQVAAELEGWRGAYLHTAFSPDGQYLFGSGWEHKIRVWHWRTGVQVLTHRAAESNLKFGPDGRLIIQEGNRLKQIEVSQAPEYRNLAQASRPGPALLFEGNVLIDPSGRLLVARTFDGFHFWDLETGDEVAHIEANLLGGVAFVPNELITNGAAGLFEWPIVRDANKPEIWEIGPPHWLYRGSYMLINCSADGRYIAQPVAGGAMVIDRQHPSRPTRLPQPGNDVRFVCISPNGRLVATGIHRGAAGARVWDVQQAKVLKEIPVGCNPAGFSPDGNLLFVESASDSRILRVGTWEEVATVPATGPVAFSQDGMLLAIGTQQGVIHLFDPLTGREKARLEDPHQDVANGLAFTPDGTSLVAVCEGKTIHVWNLRQVRSELGKLDLDWDGPDLHEAAPQPTGSLQVRIKGTESMDKLSRAMQLNDQAWPLLMGPEEKRNNTRGLEMALEAVRLAPEDSMVLNTLGVAQYRCGSYSDAIATFEKSLKTSSGESDVYDLFFLAMCHARLDDVALAKDCLDRAEKGLKAQEKLRADWAVELKQIRAEAEAEIAKVK
jgi:serine/threonine protein kinase/WD40 repeat protein